MKQATLCIIKMSPRQLIQMFGLYYFVKEQLFCFLSLYACLAILVYWDKRVGGLVSNWSRLRYWGSS